MSTETQSATTARTDSDTRGYTVMKQVRAGDLDPNTLVWLDVDPTPAADPETAIDATAKREDEAGAWKEGTKYRAASRLKTKVPTKKVDVKWS